MSKPDRYDVGDAYGGSSASSSETGIVEWEWVHVGRDFAQTHPLGQLRGWMLAVIAFVALHAAFMAYVAVFTGTPFAFIVTVIDGLAIATMLRKSPLAWPLVWISLIAAFPFSLPLMFYWADGVRPNLIYRHRFERLVPPQKGPGDV